MNDSQERALTKILVVEDEPVLAEDISLSIRGLGYSVVDAVPSAQEAIELAERFAPDLILMDIKLRGDMDGVEAATRIRARQDIPVVYVTAFLEENLSERAKRTEPYGYLGKPVSHDELRNAVEMALYKHAADKKIRESEERYRNLVEQSADGIAVVQGRILRFVNSAFARMFDCQSPEEMIGQEFLSYVAPEHREVMEKRGIERERGKDEPGFYEFTALKKDGTRFTAEIRVAATVYKGAIARQGIVRDISERKQLEEDLMVAKAELEQRVRDRTLELGSAADALRENQSTLRLIADSLPVLIAYVDSNQRYRFCNKTYELWRETPREEIEGKYIWEVVGAEDYEKARPHIEAALSGRPTDYEVSLSYPDGKQRLLRVIHVPHVDENGVTKGFASLIADISKQKMMESALRDARDQLAVRLTQRAADLEVANNELKRQIVSSMRIQKALRKNEEKYRRLHETMRDAFASVDMNGHIFETNRAFQEMLGYSEDELSELSYNDLTPEKWRPLEERIINDQVLVQGYSDVYCKEYIKKDGAILPVELRTSLIRDDNGNPSLMWAIVRDITERRKADERNRQSLKEKEALLREIHHRVKNNLAVIQSLLRIQRNRIQDQSFSETVENVQRRIRSMALCHELLCQSEDLSNINTRLYANSLLNQLIESFSVLGKRIRILREIEETLLSPDAAMPLAFILTELISNCFKHAFSESSEGLICVFLRRLDSDYLELVVKDNGAGLPEDIGVEESKSLGYKLIGIFVRQLNGKVQVIRENGTEVRIVFPF